MLCRYLKSGAVDVIEIAPPLAGRVITLKGAIRVILISPHRAGACISAPPFALAAVLVSGNTVENIHNVSIDLAQLIPAPFAEARKAETAELLLSVLLIKLSKPSLL